MKKGDTIFVGQYLFTGSETTSVWLEVPFQDSVKLKLFMLYFSAHLQKLQCARDAESSLYSYGQNYSLICG